jgi:hypothetical protein
MPAFDYNDFYIISPDYQKYNDTELIEDDLIRIIIQKYQVLVYTNQGDVLGDPNLGMNLEELLYETRLSADDVREKIDYQIIRYIPEIANTSYQLSVVFVQDPDNYQEGMLIELVIDEFIIINQIGYI